MGNDAPIVTVNADFTDGPEGGFDNIAAIIPGAVITFGQEGKRVRLRDRLTQLIGVQQGDSDAKAGAFLLWDKHRCKVLDRGFKLGVRPGPGEQMLPRFLSWADLQIDGALSVRAIAAHRPPHRYRDLWPAFDLELDELVDRSRLPSIVGIDTNTEHPRAFADRLDLLWTGHKIDGFAYDPSLELSPARPLKSTRSDHRAVLSVLTVPDRQPVPFP